MKFEQRMFEFHGAPGATFEDLQFAQALREIQSLPQITQR